MSRTENLLIFYGWPSGFNYPDNGWDLNKVALDMAKYNAIVFGSGLQFPSHGDHNNTVSIINSIKSINPSVLIFGYVQSDLDYNTFQDQVNGWHDNMNNNVNGIFFDRAGYDFGTTRLEMNQRVDYVHNQSMLCFMNAWNINHILGTANDPSYPNSIYNAGLVESTLNQSDYYLFESFAISEEYGGTYVENKDQWKARADNSKNFANYIKMASVAVINDSWGNAEELFNFAATAAYLAEINLFGSSSPYYGASSGIVKFYKRPSGLYTPGIIAQHPSNVNAYIKSAPFGRMELDFTLGFEESIISKW